MHWRTGMCCQRGKPGDQPDWIASCVWHLVKQFTQTVQDTIPSAFKLPTPPEWSQVTPRHNDSIFHLGEFSETRAHSGCPGKTVGRCQQTPMVRVSRHFPLQDLSFSVAMPVTDLIGQNNTFPWWCSTSSQPDLTSFSKTSVGCFEEEGRLWTAFGILWKFYISTLPWGKENCFCCPCENMPGIWQVAKLNTFYHCLDMLCKRSKTLIYPESVHGSTHLLVLVTRSAQWLRQTVSFTLCNLYFFLVSYKNLAKTNPLTEGNATLNQTSSGSPHNTRSDPGFCHVQTAQLFSLRTDIEICL